MRSHYHLYALEAEKFVTVQERPVPIDQTREILASAHKADHFFSEADAELNCRFWVRSLSPLEKTALSVCSKPV